jgi:demethylmenaquinone methyltransferase/2-methoxy-6-polyprenyl-1,4-benzoquinol methylase
MDFSRVAKSYTWLTDHVLWREAMCDAAKQLPPSGATLRLLDLSCGAGTSLRDLQTLRPDLWPVGSDVAYGMVKLAQQRTGRDFLQANALRLPFPSDSMDAVLIQRTYYFLPQKEALLAETLRVLRPGGRMILVNPAEGPSPWTAWREWRTPKAALDMALWHSVARRINRYTPDGIARQVEAAGFARILAEPIARGWAMLCRGEKPYPQGASTLERVAVGAAASPSSESSLDGFKGRFVHLLIRQTPNKPAWAIQPDEVITWGAVGLPTGEGQPQVLAFASLPKAVSFMQAAILAGAIRDVQKVAKFSLETARTWDFSLWLNPTLEEVQAIGGASVWVGVDPHRAATPDE